MQNAEKNDIRFTIKGIELVQSSITPPQKLDAIVENFVFNIGVSQKIDTTSKIIGIFIRIGILIPEVSEEVANLTTACYFIVENFDQLSKDEEGKIIVPETLTNTLNAISISTARGILFSTIKGTFLHNAILPIIDATKLKPQPLTPVQSL